MVSILLPLLYLVHTVIATEDSLKVAFQWKIIDFEYPTSNARWEASSTRQFIPENNVPLGLEVYGDRIFITLPRWKEGVGASLAYIKTTDRLDSPILRPYPNWEAHNQRKEVPELVSAFRTKVDSCGQLWVLDTGFSDLNTNNPKQIVLPRIIIYDLKTDKLLRVYQIPEEQFNKEDSFFSNIVIEEDGCDNSIAYLADLGKPSLVVYDFKQNRSWMVTHHYFHIDPTAGSMNVSGVSYPGTDGLYGLALSEKNEEGFSTLYFHPKTSFNEFTVSTKVLRNETALQNASAVFSEFKLLGSRGPKAQSGVSFLHKKTGVLFYSLVNLNAVACWRTSLQNYTIQSQGRIFMSNELMVSPNDIKVDQNDTLWVLSNKLPIFLYKFLDYKEYNFRILKSSVKEAIAGTACDSKIKYNHTIMMNITGNSRGIDLTASTAAVSINMMYITIGSLLLLLASR
ncbi:dopaminechrome tautomerase [Diabrotica undecimpunctata]|uniref:dopaminechrome tautomerase n=1 Tax=Diabrotica undecimpunctata TaxID=50387 RepID=UPI003B636371